MPLQELQNKTTSTEFLEWVIYLRDIEPNEFHREDWYAAQIAQEVCRTRVKKPSTIKTDRFILKFGGVQEEAMPATPEERMKKSKQAWSLLTNKKPS